MKKDTLHPYEPWRSGDYEGQLDKPEPSEVTPIRDPLLQEREKTHGSFEANAKYFNGLSKILPDNLQGSQRLAMVMIIAKIARIHSGNCLVKDHWDDIAGYAKLASEACDTP